MKEIKTIQQLEKLNRVYRNGEVGNGGAYHSYCINKKDDIDSILDIKFQNGARNAHGSTTGILDCDLLEIVRDRLTCFIDGPFSCEENIEALEGVEIALNALNKRVENRIKRNVLGTNNK